MTDGSKLDLTQAMVTALIAYEDGIGQGLDNPDPTPLERARRPRLYIDDALQILCDRGRRVGEMIGRSIKTGNPHARPFIDVKARRSVPPSPE